MTAPRFRRVTWRKRDAITEGLKSFQSGFARLLLFNVVATAALTGPAVVDSKTVEDLVNREAAFRESGGYVLVARGSIDSPSCVGLNEYPGVVAAVALKRLPNAEATNIPGSPIAVTLASPEISLIARGLTSSPWPIGPQAAVTISAAESRGLTPGRYIAIKDGHKRTAPVEISGIVDLGRLGEEYTSGVVFVTAVEAPEACAIETTSERFSDLQSVTPALVGRPGSDINVSTRMDHRASDLSFRQQYEHRSTQSVWLLGSIFIAGMWLVLRSTRRAEHGLYASLGADHSTILVIYGTELFLRVLLSLACAVIVVIPLAGVLEISKIGLISHCFREMGAAALAAFSLGFAIMALPVRAPIAAMVKDK